MWRRVGGRVKQRTQLLFLTNNCRSNFCSQPTFPCRLSMWNDVWPGWHSFVNCAIIFLQIILSSGPICPFPLWPAIQALFCQIHTRTNYSKPSRLSLLPKRSNTPFVDGPDHFVEVAVLTWRRWCQTNECADCHEEGRRCCSQETQRVCW